MKGLQKTAGIAAFYQAAAYAIGIIVFLVVLEPGHLVLHWMEGSL